MKEKKFFRQKDIAHNTICVAQTLLANLNVRVSPHTVASYLKEHPHYPSMNAISDLLEHLKMESMAVQIKKDNLKDVEFPAIAYLTKNNGHFVMLQKLQNDTVSYFDPETGLTDEPFSVFEKKWHGILLLVSPTEQSGDPDYEEHLKERRHSLWKRAGVTVALVVFLLLSVVSGLLLYWDKLFAWLPLLLIKAAGSIITVLLMVSQFHDSSVINRFCNLGKNMSCAAVMQTSISKLFGWLSLSELGAFYFIGGLFTLMLSLLSGNADAVIRFLATVNLPALPFTFYSVYYQWRKVKRWCPLCVATMVLFWLEFFTLFPILNSSFVSWSISELSFILAGFALPALCWIVLKPMVLSFSFQVPALKKRLKELTQNPAVFKVMLSQQTAIQDISFSPEIIMGNASAPVKITLALSLFCKSCGMAYQQVKQLIRDFPELAYVVIRFAVNKEKTAQGSKVALHIFSRLLDNREQGLKALDTWYVIQNEKKWMAQLPKHDLSEQAQELLKAHGAWAERMRVNRTPMYFIHDRPLSAVYEGKDIGTYLKALAREKEMPSN